MPISCCWDVVAGEIARAVPDDLVVGEVVPLVAGQVTQDRVVVERDICIARKSPKMVLSGIADVEVPAPLSPM